MQTKIVVSCFVLVAVLCNCASAETDCSKHPEGVDPKTCCPMPELVTDELKQKCQEFNKPQMGGPDSPNGDDARPRPHPRPHPPHHHPCFMSCVYNETGILNAEQKLDEAKLQEYLTNTFKDNNQQFIPIVETAFKTCSVKGEEMRAKWAANKEKKMAANPNGNPERAFKPRCPMAAGFLTGCVFMETFQNCPSGVWKDDDQCNNLRAFMKDCKPDFGKHRGPPGGMENQA